MPTILQNHHVLAVHNIRQSARFYIDILGFKIIAEPPGWIFLKKDHCTIMLGECPNDLPPAQLGSHNYFAYLHVDDADAYHAQIQRAGHQPLAPPTNQPWAMREFPLQTPDGHRLMIGQSIAQPAAG